MRFFPAVQQCRICCHAQLFCKCALTYLEGQTTLGFARVSVPVFDDDPGVLVGLLGMSSTSFGLGITYLRSTRRFFAVRDSSTQLGDTINGRKESSLSALLYSSCNSASGFPALDRSDCRLSYTICVTSLDKRPTTFAPSCCRRCCIAGLAVNFGS